MSNIEIKELPKYKVKTINSKVTTYFYESISNIAAEIENGYIVLWQAHSLFVANITNGKYNWMKATPNELYFENNSDNMVQLRAFDLNKEIHLWKTGHNIMGRLRVDNTENSNTGIAAIDTEMALRAVVANSLQTDENFYINSDKKFFVKIRNYIDYNAVGQAGHGDYRFVDIIQKK